MSANCLKYSEVIVNVSRMSNQTAALCFSGRKSISQFHLVLFHTAMEINLQQEDLLIKLRAKLNEEKIKLWESPYLQPDDTLSQSLKDLATKYAAELSSDEQTVLSALHELQIHSLERSKANAEFKETGWATFRIRATLPGEKAQVLTLRRKLDVMGSELIAAIAEELKVVESRIKLIFNGKVVKPTPSLEEQGLKNGAQLMALILTESPEEAKQEDTMYMEMKQTRDDAMLLSECVDELADDDEYMKLEDQSGNAIELPHAEKKSLLVGLALHERGREHIKKQEYAMALVLLLEADRQFNECRSSILQSVDNYAVLQVDVSWCYLCLRALSGAADAARRLAAAEAALARTYGARGERLRALKGTDANERVLFMRLYLLQGVVAYHQNRREQARELLLRAEGEINALRVDEASVSALMELGWSCAAARAGLRAAGGDLHAAHHYLAERRDERSRARAQHKDMRERGRLGLCADGSPLSAALVAALEGMGYARALAAAALRRANNHAGEAVRLIQEEPLTLEDEESDSSESGSPSSGGPAVEPDDKVVAELVAMGYGVEAARTALGRSGNRVPAAVDFLLACDGTPDNAAAQEQANPSTSAGAASRRHLKRMDQKRASRRAALQRLRAAIRSEEDDYLDSSLREEEDFLVQYKSLL